MEGEEPGEDRAGLAAAEQEGQVSPDFEVMKALPGWDVDDKVVPVRHGETKIGEATLRVVDGKVIASIVMDGGEDVASLVGVRMGINGQTVLAHEAEDGTRVVDLVRVLAVVVG